MEVDFLSGDRQNSTRCTNIKILNDMIIEDTKYFNVVITTNDTGVIVMATNMTVSIQDSDSKG